MSDIPLDEVAMSTAPVVEQFWLLTGDVPTGPFSVTQIHVMLAAENATWQTLACPVGESQWLPLAKTAGIGPRVASEGTSNTGSGKHAGKPPQLLAATPSSHLPPIPAAASNDTEHKPKATDVIVGIGLLVLVVGIVGAAGYGLYEWVRPLSAVEVCKKLDEVKTAAETKKYVTPRMYPLVDEIFRDKSPADPNDVFEWSQEVDGSTPDTKLVGFRGSWFLQEEGRRVKVEGHARMVKSDGWKVDDVVFTGVEGVALSRPLSLVDEHVLALARSRIPASSVAPQRTNGGQLTPGQYGNTWQGTPVGKAFTSLKEAVGWGGIVVIAVVALIGVAIYNAPRKKSQSRP